MKKSLSLVAALLALVLLPALAEAVLMGPSNPVTITLDNPNQTVAAPSSGFLTLGFSGTIVVDPNYTMIFAGADNPFNMSQTNSLTASFDAAFLTFFGGGNGTYTGNIFDITVPMGTPADLYAFEELSTNPSVFSITAVPLSNANSPDGGPPPFTATAAFSVLVTSGSTNGVPEGGSSVVLLGLSVGGLLFARRALT